MGSMLTTLHYNLGKSVVVHQLRMVDILIYSLFVVEQLLRQQQLAVVENLVVVCTFQTVVEVEEQVAEEVGDPKS